MDAPKSWDEIRAWRKRERARLIALRVALGADEHRLASQRITAALVQGFAPLAAGVIGFCWPFQREFDPRFAVRRFRERGAKAVLPAVVDPKGPLQFREWWPGAPMAPGVYDIPVPQGTAVLKPDAAIVPMNGFDSAGFRLGYGGGYFDRTLAALAPRPLAIGVSFEALRLASIFPQPHDIAMDFVVTEAATYRVCKDSLLPIGAEQCMREVTALCTQRGLSCTRLDDTDDAVAREYSSPACYAHEFPGYFGEDAAADPQPAPTPPKSS